MASVTQLAAKYASQSSKYISIKDFKVVDFNNDDTLDISSIKTSISSQLVGIAVDYLVRLELGADPIELFKLCIEGSKKLTQADNDAARDLLKNINDEFKHMYPTSSKCIESVCKISAYDICYRAGVAGYSRIGEIVLDEATTEYIRTLTKRSKEFFKENGPVVSMGQTFEGAYNEYLTSGDCDYITNDTLWDLKTSKRTPVQDHVLQVIIYYIALQHSNNPMPGINILGFYNPRLNKSWTINISAIDKELLDFVEFEILHYNSEEELLATYDNNQTDIYSVIQDIREKATSEADKGSRFESACRFYLMNDPAYSNLFSDVWLWKDAPTNDGHDIGIDIVAKEKKSGDFWAIQCKCYRDDVILNYDDVSTFYGATGPSAEKYSHNMIMTTCEQRSLNLNKVADTWNTVFVTPSIMQESPIDWQAFIEGKSPSKRNLYKPRDHQKQAISACLSGFTKADRGKLIMACGTGKTLTSLRLAEEYCPTGFVLFLAPSISLVAQTMREWANQAYNPLTCAVVCSDAKASRADGDVWETSLRDIGFPATTDAEELYRQIEVNKNSEGLSVVFSTYQSIQVVIDAQKLGTPAFDLCICDEAHRTTGARDLKESKENESAFTKVHDASILKANKRLYMTATPRIYGEKAKKKARVDDFEISSMDDVDKYGEEFYRLAFDKAVELGLLSDYRVLVLAVSESFVSSLYQDSMFEDEEGFSIPEAAKILGCWKGLATKGKRTKLDDVAKDELNERDLNNNSAGNSERIEYHWVTEDTYNPMRRAVAFTQQIKESEQLKEQFKHVTDVFTEKTKKSFPINVELQHVDGKQSSVVRKKKLNWLKESNDPGICRILTNAKCLSEGIDVPNLDAVLFMKPRKSKIDIVQAVGRVMRKAPGKEYGYIILPVVIPSGKTPEEALDDNETFSVVWEVLQGLRSHDERLEAEINSLEFEHDKGGSTHLTIDVLDEDEPKQDQMVLTFESRIDEWQDALEVKTVKKCGTRVYWDDWAKDVADIAKRHIESINNILDNCEGEAQEFDKFLKGLQDSLNPGVTKEDAVEMLAQHMITLPIFEALFGESSFVKSNPVSIAMEEMLNALEKHHIEEEKDDIKLQSLYDSVKRRVAFVDSDEGRQRLIKDLYEKFFSAAFKKTSEKMGIVYTPNEIVDYILYSTDRMLKKEFGKGLGDKGVHILDPFAGTGTFMANLINSDIISDKDLPYKYKHEMHSNEILLLAYYIMVINIEQSYHSRIGGEYEPFEGAVLTDTFQMTEEGDTLDTEIFTMNSDRVVTQNKLPIRVIVGNPPYSAIQKSENDNNKNDNYNSLDNSISSTYGKYSSSNATMKIYDSYIRAFKWASDRLSEEGMIAFITNGGWLDSKVFDGMRYCLSKEFNSIWVVNLRGHKEFRRLTKKQLYEEGDNVFGSGSKAGITITFLVKKTQRTDCSIYYWDLGKGLTINEKFNLLYKHKCAEPNWVKLEPDRFNDWINQRDESWYKLAPIAIEKFKEPTGVYSMFSLGVVTNRDKWAISFSKSKLAYNLNKYIDFYNSELTRWNKAGCPKQITDFIEYEPKKISWTRSLKNHLKNNMSINFDKDNIVLCAYRPFVKEYLYYAKELNEMQYQTRKIFPNYDCPNVAIICPGNGNTGFNCLIVDKIFDLNFLNAGTQCFPLYYYENDCGLVYQNSNTKEYSKHNAITDTTLNVFQSVYPKAFQNSEHFKSGENVPRTKKKGGIEINKEDIFYYIYCILHSREYRARFESNLQKELPRIPFTKDFVVFSKFGRTLAKLHLKYEEVEPWPNIIEEGDSKNPGKTIKMRFGKCEKSQENPKGEDKTVIHVSENLTLKNIPLEAYEYVVNGKSAIGWIMDRYQIRTDKASGIVNDPNEYSDNPRYIVDLLKSVVTVSMRTLEIVEGLPPLNELPQPENWPYAWKVQNI